MSISNWPRLALLASMMGTIAVTGCDKSSSGSAGSAGTPGKAGEEAYGKKLVGTWLGTEEMKPGEPGMEVVIEFKADNGFKATFGPFDMKGTWKLTKEEGKSLTVETEVTMPGFDDPKAPAKPQKKSFTIVFDDANNVTMTSVGEKPDAKKLKRKA